MHFGLEAIVGSLLLFTFQPTTNIAQKREIQIHMWPQ